MAEHNQHASDGDTSSSGDVLGDYVALNSGKRSPQVRFLSADLWPRMGIAHEE